MKICLVYMHNMNKLLLSAVNQLSFKFLCCIKKAPSGKLDAWLFLKRVAVRDQQNKTCKTTN